MKIADQKIEPPAAVRGDVARIYLYMNAAYPGRGIISAKNEKLFAAWNASDPVDAWECVLYQKINALQGNENEILRDACAGNAPPAADTPAPQKTETSGEFACSPKKTCKEMISCAEAQYRLKECGQKQLDRDKDGIPCETLCRE